MKDKQVSKKIVWEYRNPDPKLVRSIARALNATDIFASLLVNRGIHTAKEASSYISPSFRDLKDPFILKGMQKGVDRICQALENREKILIFGDFDADGVTSTSLLLDFLNHVNAEVTWFIPHRIKEGYGFQEEHIAMAVERDIDLIITADCGSGSHEAVLAADREDIDVIVTDHHEIEDRLPPAWAVINPKRKDCSAGLEDLSGVGVVFYLVIALRKQLRDTGFFIETKEPNLLDYCDLVAIGTIGDMVPLSRENRFLCMKGIETIKKGARIGLRTISSISKIKCHQIDSDDLSFRIVPRLNAAGRLSHARICVQLLTETEKSTSEKIATVLDSLNHKRQKIERDIILQIEEKISRNKSLLEDLILILCNENWDPSVIGIAASKTAKKHALPVILLSTANEMAVGSCRSVNTINLYDVIKKCAHLLEKFGGHAMAAGITIKKNNIEAFAECIKENIHAVYDRDDFNKKITVDRKLSLEDINMRLVNEIETMRPFGTGNPEPLFQSEKIEVLSSTIIGTNHRKMLLGHPGSASKTKVHAIQFNVSDPQNLPVFYDKIVYKIRQNKFQKDAFQIIIETP